MASEARGGLEPATLRKWIPVGIVAAILLGVAAMVIARELVSPAPPDPPARAAPAAPAAPAADGVARFRDAEGAFSISYPGGWERVVSSDPEVRLLAQGDGSSMLVRMGDLGIEVGPENLEAARKLTDKLVRSAGQAKQLRPPRRVSLGGLTGFLYLYTFADAASGQRGAHAHYFLFRGETLFTIVFQTVPAERLPELAPLFDRIGETLRTAPG